MALAQRIDAMLPFLRHVEAAVAVIRAEDRVCVFANATLEALYGGRVLTGKNVTVAHPELRGAGLFDRADEVFATGQAVAVPALSVLVASEDGSTLEPAVLDVLVAPIQDGESIEGAVIFAREIDDSVGDGSLLLAREQNARRMAEANTRRLARLQTMTAALGEAVTSPEIGELIVTHLVEAFGARAAAMFVIRGDDLELVADRGAPQRSSRHSLDAEGPATHTARTGDALFLESAAGIASLFPGPGRDHVDATTRAFASVPLRQHGDVVGVLTMGFSEARPFCSEDRAFFRSLANLSAQALHRAALYEAEHHAKEEALAASRVKDEFLATLSHELRTPLQAILGWARLLRGGLDPALTSKAAHSIDRSARTQARLIADILDASRIISGRMHIEKRATNPRHFVTSAVDALELEAEARKVTLTTSFSELSDDFAGDPDRLQQVVSNLVANAVKFTPEGGRVGIDVREEDAELVIRVEDDGAGITADFLPFVFDRFRQAESGTTRSCAGLGLGLAIVRHIVELHDGSVMAESPGEGRGATFTVRLPGQGADPNDPRDSSTTEVTRLACGPTLLEGVRVLVVDDDESALELVAAALQRFGATVLAASGAKEALERLHELRPHAIVSDLGMPDVDGYELLRRIRALGSDDPLASVPALALTAYAREVERQHALAAGFQLHLSKPIDPSELARAVRSIVGEGPR